MQDKRELVVLWVERLYGKHQKSGAVYTSQLECTETGTIMCKPFVCLVNLHSQRLPKSFGISKVILERVSTLHYKSLEVIFPRGPVSPLSVCKS